jgi:2-amino-4-hydroxy-6-hydroxymethyldihydropteridine diphosphokinase
MKPHCYGLALGSNLGDRASLLHAGLAALQESAPITGLRVAPMYETAPVDCPPGSQSFVNSAAVFFCALEPQDLLLVLQTIERRLGRPSEREVNAPRPLDLDILFVDDLVINTPGLIVPHPRMTQRAFVMQPLADLVPDLVLPGQTKTVAELLTTLTH